MIELSGPYQKRPIRFQGIWEHHGWRLKLYGISALSEVPPAELVDATKLLAVSLLPTPAVTDARYGVGFLYAHEGRNGGGYASVNWWLNENELQHHQYEAPPQGFDDLKSVEITGGSDACAWDLAVIAFERNAWVDVVLANEQGADLDGYLACQMNEDV